MKKLLTALLVAAAIPVGIQAQKTADAMAPNKNVNSVQVPFKADYKLPMAAPSKYDQTLEKYNVVGTIAGSFSLYTLSTPIVYEPKSHLMFRVIRENLNPENSSATMLDGSLSYFVSTDYGLTWGNGNRVYRENMSYPIDPSIAVLNPNNSTDASDLSIVINAPKAVYTSADKYSWMGQYAVVTPEGLETFDFTGPNENNPGGKQLWYNNQMTQSDVNGLNFISYGKLRPADEVSKGGYYGFSNVMLPDLDIISSIPTTWDISKFRPVSSGQGTYNNDMTIKPDNQGNLYAAVNNMFADDIDHRVVAVSKSEDNGATWSEFNRCPVSVLKAFYLNEGGTGEPITIPYEMEGFVVYGVDTYSYFVKLYDYDESSQQITVYEIAEVSYKNGNWSVQKVADLTGLINWVLFDGVLVKDGEDTKIFMEDNEFGHEIQASITADNKYMVVKWIDVNSENPIYNHFPTTVLNRRTTDQEDDPYTYTEYSMDSLAANDIYLAAKDLETGLWLAPINITNDAAQHKATKMPEILPSINNIPIFSMRTAANLNAENYPNEAALPQIVQQYLIGVPQELILQTIDYLNFNSVKEQTNNAFNLNKAFPNPAQNDVTVSFQLKTAGNVTLRLYNTMGEMVYEVINNKYFGEGSFNVPFNVSKLANGSYFYTLTSNGVTATDVLNIVR